MVMYNLSPDFWGGVFTYKDEYLIGICFRVCPTQVTPSSTTGGDQTIRWIFPGF